MRFIGDIHGKFKRYQQVLDCEKSIQIGDFGIGFGSNTQSVASFDKKIAEWQQAHPQHRFIRGNHDNPAVCKTMPGYIPDGTVEGDTMFIGGAWSIDHAFRKEGASWWRDEELSYEELYQLADLYEETKPRVMVTHDCPEAVAYELILKQTGWHQHRTRTGQALEEMFQRWKPEVWIFGHWHFDIDEVIDGTRFICLNELSYIDLDKEDSKIVPYGEELWTVEAYLEANPRGGASWRYEG